MKDGPFDFGALVRPYLPSGSAPVAVAVSGGPDSMALCHALSHIAQNPVHALTVDHGLRPESAEEAAQVGRWLKGWPRTRHHILTRVLAQKPAARLQEDARRDRYRLLADYCAAHGISRLFTAHHLDDQAETFLFRLAKGSGLDGLGAMRPGHVLDERLQVVRPLLDLPKAALVDYCRAHDVPFVQDPSNDDGRFARARLRRSAAILAQEGLSPKRLAMTAARLARARAALDEIAAQQAEKAMVEKDASRIVFDFLMLRDQPAEIRLRVFLAAMAQVSPAEGGYGPRLEKAEALAEKVFTDPAFKKATLGGCCISIGSKRSRLLVEKEPSLA